MILLSSMDSNLEKVTGGVTTGGCIRPIINIPKKMKPPVKGNPRW